MCEFCLDPSFVRTDKGYNLFDPQAAVDRAIAAALASKKVNSGIKSKGDDDDDDECVADDDDGT
jgi:hypothetical protein